jgi:hypothetical protein
MIKGRVVPRAFLLAPLVFRETASLTAVWGRHYGRPSERLNLSVSLQWRTIRSDENCLLPSTPKLFAGLCHFDPSLIFSLPKPQLSPKRPVCPTIADEA